MTTLSVAIVDYGLGNLHSVQLACEHVGLAARITSDRREVLDADAVILPGVGAFGDAMGTLNRLDLVGVLRDVAASGKPLFGICLGLQLLMESSEEFGQHQGLGIIKGRVVPLGEPRENGRRLKVPQVGWNGVQKPATVDWSETPLRDIATNEMFYFVHSFVVVPEDEGVVCSTTAYGDVDFCSSVRYGNVFACQFHPERSGERGLTVYHNLVHSLSD